MWTLLILVSVPPFFQLIFFEGMCRRFMIDGQRRPARKRAHFRGTYRYASLRMHSRKECGPSDDIQSWLYSMVEMHSGELPWTHVREVGRLHSKKKQTPLAVLCSAMPAPFLWSCEYVTSLGVDDPIDYDHIHSLWRSCLNSLAEYTRKFDWEQTNE